MSAGEIIRQGWLTKSKEPILLLRFFKSKWVRRYFVLHCGNLPGQSKLVQYQNETKKKKTRTLDLDLCSRVDSYLCMSNSDGQNEYDWIFAMHISKRELYLAAESEEDMNEWVRDLCRVCNLERKENSSPEQIQVQGLDYTLPGFIHPTASFDSILDTPTAEKDIHEQFANAVDTENEDRMCKIEFPPHHDYLHIKNFSGRNEPTQKESYIVLSDCITAQPRPKDRDVSVTPENVQLSPTIHSRNVSSDSATSSRSISVSDTESSSCNLTTKLDVVPPPPPRPPKSAANVVNSTPFYRNERPICLPHGYDAPISSLNQRPSAPIPNQEEEGSSAETIKAADENNCVAIELDDANLYLNIGSKANSKNKDKSPAPKVDRSKKPSRKMTPSDGGDRKQPMTISRIESFVKRQHNSSDCTRLPILPKTTPISPVNIQFKSHSTGNPSTHQEIVYIEPSFSSSTPLQSPAELNPPVSGIQIGRIDYIALDDTATKAISETISTGRTLDRKKK